MARKKSNGESKEVRKVQENLPAVGGMFEADAGAGFESTGMDDYAVPFLTVLQKMSPQVDPDNPAHVKGAEPGDFYNTATQQVYKALVTVVPVHYERKFAEWVPRERGGGFRGHHEPESPEVVGADRDDSGRFVMGNGNSLMDTRYHFVLIVDEGGSAEQAVMALSSTQIKSSRLWMTAMRNVRMTARDGRKFTPPMFSTIYEIRSITQQNDKGTWKGVAARILRPLSSKEADLYEAAKAFRGQILAGRARVDDAALGDNAEIPLEEESF